jgi:hypothetical protein
MGPAYDGSYACKCEPTGAKGSTCFGFADGACSFTVRAHPGRSSGPIVSHSKSGFYARFYGAFVWARRALNSPKRRSLARAVPERLHRRRPAHLRRAGDCENDAKLARKLGQPPPLIAVFPQECTGQLACSGPT